MKKIKQILESDKGRVILIITIVILTSLASFGLGRVSKSKESNGLRVLYKELSEDTTSVTTSNGLNLSSNTQNELNIAKFQEGAKKGFVASKIGNKYYPIDCSAANNLKESNKIYFSTEKEAINAGYTKSASCD